MIKNIKKIFRKKDNNPKTLYDTKLYHNLIYLMSKIFSDKNFMVAYSNKEFAGWNYAELMKSLNEELMKPLVRLASKPALVFCKKGYLRCLLMRIICSVRELHLDYQKIVGVRINFEPDNWNKFYRNLSLYVVHKRVRDPAFMKFLLKSDYYF